MQKLGVPTAILGTLAFGILGLLAFLVIERAVPDPDPDPGSQAGEAASLDSLRLELERERMALESLRFRAQIQADLAAAEADLARAAAMPPVLAPEAGAPEVAPDPEPALEPIIHNDINLVTSQPAALGNFVPDPVAYEEFSEPLESYGDWYETDDYGPIWRPDETYVDNSWAPYTNGSWGYSNYGWNWESRDPFGWACDHYGRWLYISRHGWVWVPGRQWAPAWVSWRSCNTHIGWAPLPPCATWNRSVGIGGWVDGYCNIGPRHYNFVHRSHFGSSDCRSSIVDRSHNAGLVGRSKNVTRIKYGKHGINNHGPGYHELRSESSEPIRRRTIDLADESRRKREKVEQGRDAGLGRMGRAGIERLQDVRRETGWESGARRGEELQLRRQLVSEARGSLLEQPRPTSRSLAGRTLTAITKPAQSRGGQQPAYGLPASQPARAEIVQVGVRSPSVKQVATGNREVAGDRPPGLPDHFAAERAQREATVARQQASMAERNRLASARQSAEREARQRLDQQIRGRSQPATGNARSTPQRQSRVALASTSDSPSIQTRSRSGTAEQAPSPRSRSAATIFPSESASRTIQKQARPSAASRSSTRPQLGSRRTLTSSPSLSSTRRSVSPVNTTAGRRTAPVTRSRPTTTSSRQQKSTRAAVAPRRSVPQTASRTRTQPQSRPQPQPQRSSPPPTRTSPQPQSQPQSKQVKQASSSGRSSGSQRSRK